MTRPWPAGAVTGIGSLPGTDPVDAAALVLGELPELPHLAELPARGPGAELIGRGAALLVDLPVELAPSGWRITAHAGRDLRRARDLLERDLDALESQAGGYRGALKVQAAGPWTLAAEVELATGHKLVADHGAVRDLTASLREGLRLHLADVAARVPGASLVLQLDEPSLPAVLGGRVPTPSGYGTVRAVAAETVEESLRVVLGVAAEGGRVVHCCADDVPLTLLRAAGADAVSLDASLLGRDSYDALGEAVQAGLSLWLGVTGAGGTLDDARAAIRRLWSELGFPRADLAAVIVPTPTCGLARATPEEVRRVLAVLRDVGKSLLDEG
jgi:Cobalamin-independent synthase, Catalytic domain